MRHFAAGAVASALLLSAYWYAKAGHGKQITPKLTAFFALCLAVFLGSRSQQVPLMQTWMQQSSAELRATLVSHNDATQPSATDENGQQSQKLTQQQLDRRLRPLQLGNYNVDKPIVVAFNNHGLVLLEDKQFTPLTIPKHHMLSAVLPDGTIIHQQPGDAGQTLARSRVTKDGIENVWAKTHFRLYLNHWGDAFRGKYYHPGREYHTLPNKLSKQFGKPFANCKVKNSFYHQIIVFDATNGKKLKRVDLLPILAEYEEGEELRKEMNHCKNPLHTNSVQVLKNEREAGYFPNANVGDMLVSLRDVHAILLLDKDTFEPKWHVFGKKDNKFLFHHSPRITDRGTLLVFDNRGGDEPNGRSRVVELDLPSGEMVGHYEASGDEFFFTVIAGKVQYLDDGRILVQEEHGSKQNPRNQATMFLLDCPGKYISMDCRRTDIFRGKEPDFSYNNAVLLP